LLAAVSEEACCLHPAHHLILTRLGEGLPGKGIVGRQQIAAEGGNSSSMPLSAMLGIASFST